MTVDAVKNATFVFLALVALGLVSAAYVVDANEFVVITQFGRTKAVIDKPGLHFHLPLLQNNVALDRRIIAIGPFKQQIGLAHGQDGALSRITVDAALLYRVADPQAYVKTFGSDVMTERRLRDTSSFKDAFSQTGIDSDTLELDDIAKTALGSLKSELAKDGIEILSLDLTRIAEPENEKNDLARLADSENNRAVDIRKDGQKIEGEIRAAADEERAALLADGERQAAAIRADANRQAAGITAAAYGQDREFYAFTRTLEAYRNTLATPATRIILSPNSGFFRYMNKP